MAMRPIGLRRELLLLLPVTVLVLVGISAFTLFAYRSAIELLVEERQREASSRAAQIARALSSDRPAPSELRELAPLALGVAISDVDGRASSRSGDLPDIGLLVPLAGKAPDEPTAVGPSPGELLDRIAAFAPRGAAGARVVVRVDVAARRLAAQQRGLRVLTVVVLVVDLALALLVLLFLGRLLAPWDRLLAEARRVESPEAAGQDEVAHLLATFERAVDALAAPPDPEEDIQALQRALAPSLASGLLLLDHEGKVLALNPIGVSLLGLEAPEEPVPIERLLRPHPELLATLSDPERTPERSECEITAGDQPRTLGITSHPLRRDDGTVRGQLVLFTDLTEVRRRTREERLARSLEEIGSLTAGLAHELRNSLATLRGYLTLAARSPEEGSLADYLGEMRREADQLQRILDDFLAFARPGSSRAERLDPEELALRAVADPSLNPPGARVVEAPETPATVHGDRQLLVRALRNVLHNAAQAHRQAGVAEPVELRIRTGPDELEFLIEDRGMGIPPELKETIFVPFVTGREDGVGLGLAVTHRIVTLHGGGVRQEDRATGGTRFRLSFPLTDPLPKVTTGSATSSSQGATRDRKAL